MQIKNQKKLNYLVNAVYHYKLLQNAGPSGRSVGSTLKLRMFVTTWNCGDLEMGPLDDQPWLNGSKDCDVVAIGMQEAGLDNAFKRISEYFQDSDLVELEKIRMLYVMMSNEDGHDNIRPEESEAVGQHSFLQHQEYWHWRCSW